MNLRKVGEPITSYIRKRKLSCAAEELINTKKAIVDIALFGYETWAVLTNISESVITEMQHSNIIIKDFEGGLYATAEATYGPVSNLDKVWKSLHYWLMQNQQYNYCEHQWLEDHITRSGEGGFHSFKLYLPIQPIGNC